MAILSMIQDWYVYMTLPVVPEETDLLRLEVLDEDYMSKDDAIGVVLEPAHSGRLTSGQELVAELKMLTKTKPKNGKPSTLTFRHISTLRADDPAFSQPCFKTVFVIRHGESKWNEAQEGLDVKVGSTPFEHHLPARLVVLHFSTPLVCSSNRGCCSSTTTNSMAWVLSRLVRSTPNGKTPQHFRRSPALR